MIVVDSRIWRKHHLSLYHLNQLRSCFSIAMHSVDDPERRFNVCWISYTKIPRELCSIRTFLTNFG